MFFVCGFLHMKKFLQIYVCFSAFIQAFWLERKAATAIEYALMAGGIALVIIAVVFAIGDELAVLFQEVEDGFSGP
mgnify:CR=1 FL=1